jgi:hypothetical protein
MTQNAHKLLCGSRKSKKPNPPPILRGEGRDVVGALLQHTKYSIAYKWNMHIMTSKKIVSNFTQKGLQEKQSRMKERKGKEVALLLLLPTHMGLIHALSKQW